MGILQTNTTIRSNGRILNVIFVRKHLNGKDIGLELYHQLNATFKRSKNLNYLSQ